MFPVRTGLVQAFLRHRLPGRLLQGFPGQRRPGQQIGGTCQTGLPVRGHHGKVVASVGDDEVRVCGGGDILPVLRACHSLEGSLTKGPIPQYQAGGLLVLLHPLQGDGQVLLHIRQGVGALVLGEDPVPGLHGEGGGAVVAGLQGQGQGQGVVPAQLLLVRRQGIAGLGRRQGDSELGAGLDGDGFRRGGKVVLVSGSAELIGPGCQALHSHAFFPGGNRHGDPLPPGAFWTVLQSGRVGIGDLSVLFPADGFVFCFHKGRPGPHVLFHQHIQDKGCGRIVAILIHSDRQLIFPCVFGGRGGPAVTECAGGACLKVFPFGCGDIVAIEVTQGIVSVPHSSRCLVNGQVEGGRGLHIVLGGPGFGGDLRGAAFQDGHCAVCAHRGNGGVTAGVGDLAVPDRVRQGVDEGAVPIGLGDGSLGKGQGLGNGADGDGEVRNRTQGVVILVLAGQGSRVGNRLVLAGLRRCDGSSTYLCPQVISLCLLVEGHGSLGDRHGGLVRRIVPVLGGEAAGDIHDSGGNGHGKGLALQDIAAAVHHRKEPVCPHRELGIQGPGLAGAHRCAAVLRPQLVPLYGDTGLDLLGLGPHPQAEDHIAAAVHLPHVILGGDLFLIGVGAQLADDLYTGKGGGGHTDVAQILLVIIVSIILIRLHLVWIGLIRCILEHLPGSQHVLEVVKGHVP